MTTNDDTKANIFSSTGFDFSKFCEASLDTARKREINGGIKLDTLSLLKHCATEVIEATDAFNKYKIEMDIKDQFGNENSDTYAKTNFENELGDIICCVSLIAAQYNMNLDNILERCWKKNEDRANMCGDKL